MKAVVVLHLSIALWGSEKRDDHSSFECWLIEFEHTQTLYQEDNVARLTVIERAVCAGSGLYDRKAVQPRYASMIRSVIRLVWISR